MIALTTAPAIMFGNLVDYMNDFYAYVPTYKQNPNDPAVINEFNNRKAAFKDGVNYNCLMLFVIAICMFIAVYGFFYIFTLTSERISRRVRLMYLRAVLRQDAGFHDRIGIGEIASRLETETLLFQASISEKVALSTMFLSSFLVAFVIAFSQLPRLAGILFIVVPCIAVAMVVLVIFVTKFEEKGLQSIAESGTLAEETISTIRTAKAYGLSSVLVGLYDGYLGVARREGFKLSAVASIGFASFDWMAYCSYALAFVAYVHLFLGGRLHLLSLSHS